MAKNKKPKKRRNKRKRNPSGKSVYHNMQPANSADSYLEYFSYKITNEPIQNSSISEEVKNEMEDIFYKSRNKPSLIIDRLEELIKKYPYVPPLYNYISVAYANLGDNEKAKQYIIENYEKNPDYLFAKLNYAEKCMVEGDYDKVSEIFDHKFDLKALYPHRDVFHITEVIGFFGTAGFYFAHTGKKEAAKLFYKNLKELSPNHNFTKRLKHLITDSITDRFKNLIDKIEQ